MEPVIQFITENLTMIYILTLAIFFGYGGDIQCASGAAHPLDVRSQCGKWGGSDWCYYPDKAGGGG